MSRFSTLSPDDFEELVADLLGAERGCRYEVFAAGPDGGIDLRRRTELGQLEIVQIKRYERSSFSTLRAAAMQERQKMDVLGPDLYRFVTSYDLTVGQKGKLAADLAPHIRDPSSEILGCKDLERLLTAHGEVERRHPRLWLSSGTQLMEMVHADVRDRSRALLADIESALPTYVRPRSFATARERLHENRVLILTGDPGVGKTTLAQMLVADALWADYDEPVAISRHPDEARRVFDPERRQVLLYDDFLGRFALERLDKNQDRELAGLMRMVTRAPHTLLILTTRDYIFSNASQVHEGLRHEDVGRHRFLLDAGQYGLVERSRIFLNHVHRSRSLPAAAGAELLAEDAYLRVLEHSNYNPRRIAYLTGMAGPALRLDEGESYVELAVAMLDDAASLWKQTFRHELTEEERALLLALASAGCEQRVEELRRLYAGVASQLDASADAGAFEDALCSLDGSMVRTYEDFEQNGGEMLLVAFSDPSVEEYVTDSVREHPGHIAALCRSAVAFEQLEWLVDHCDSREIEKVADDLAGAIRRTCRADPISWAYAIHDNGESPSVSLRRNTNHIYGRLVTVRRFVIGCPRLETLLADWWIEQLTKEMSAPGIVTPGIRSVGSRDDLFALVEGGRDYLESMRDGPKRLRETMTRDLHDAGAWARLGSLHRFWPELFGRRRWRKLQRDAEEWASEVLNYPHEFDGEVDEIGEAAQLMGIEISDEQLQRARENSYRSFDELPDYEPPAPSDRMPAATTGERQIVRAMFERLAREADASRPMRD
jgi:hypothetical protein